MKKIFGNYTLRDVLIDLVYTAVGTALVGFALSMFTVPNDIAPGGEGVGRMPGGICMRFAFPAGRYAQPALVADIIRQQQRRLHAQAGCCAAPPFDIRGISTGGTDLLALILKKLLPNLPTGTLLMFVDATVVVIATLIFRDFDVAIYSAITIYVCSKVIDALTQGVDYAKVIYTVSSHGEEIARALNENTDRGSTLIPAFGGYTGESKQIVMTVTRRSVVAQTLRLIRQTDPKSFSFVMDSTEVHGEGFKVD